MSDPTQSPKASTGHVVVDSLAPETQDPEPLVRVGYQGAPQHEGGLPEVDDDVMVVGIATVPPRRPPQDGAQGPGKGAGAARGATSTSASSHQDAQGRVPDDGGMPGGDDDDPLGLYERRPVAQVVVIVAMVVLLVLAALYVLDYWGVAPTGFSGLVDGIGTRMG